MKAAELHWKFSERAFQKLLPLFWIIPAVIYHRQFILNWAGTKSNSWNCHLMLNHWRLLKAGETVLFRIFILMILRLCLPRKIMWKSVIGAGEKNRFSFEFSTLLAKKSVAILLKLSIWRYLFFKNRGYLIKFASE